MINRYWLCEFVTWLKYVNLYKQGSDKSCDVGEGVSAAPLFSFHKGVCLVCLESNCINKLVTDYPVKSLLEMNGKL